jgi:hypothetical protein
LDDDEIPQDGWLCSWLRASKHSDRHATFGKIIPEFDGNIGSGRHRLVTRMFSRVFEIPDGSIISDKLNKLGTGNSMFRREKCFSNPQNMFLSRYNKTGGEDIAFITSLMSHGVELFWNGEGLVKEILPASRTSLKYLADRRFNQGVLRVRFASYSRNRVRFAIVPALMLAGMAQFFLNRVLYLYAKFRGSETADYFYAQSLGGLGKLFWARKPNQSPYAN